MDYKTITDLTELKQYLGDSTVVAFDFETAPNEPYRKVEKAALDPYKSSIVGVSFSVSEGTAVYVPIAHKVGKNADRDKAVCFLQTLMTNSLIVKVAHNLSFEAMFLYHLGIIIQPPCYDTIAASQMTLKTDTEFRKLSHSGLKGLATEFFKAEMPSFEEVTNGRHFDELDPAEETAMRYACADSDYTLRLYNLTGRWFDRWLPKHRQIVEQVESPTAIYTGLMKRNGLLVDKELMVGKQVEAEQKMEQLAADIAAIIGDVEIGANASTAAFKKYLYDDLGLPVLKTTAKFQEAADDEALVLLSDWCAACTDGTRQNKPELVPLFTLVQEYRKWSKIKSTYIDGYLDFVSSATGRIHPNLFPLGTETGRFSARNPNMQNCFDAETEILTPRGFVYFHDLEDDDKVAQWENGEITFVSPSSTIMQDFTGELVHIQNQHIDLCVTPDHRCLLQDRKNRQFVVLPAALYGNDHKQLHAGQYSFGAKSLNPCEVMLLAATQADGSYHDGGIDFCFEKARKYRGLMEAIHGANVPHSDYVKADGRVNIRLLKSDFTKFITETLGAKKSWGPWLLEYDRKTVKAIISEIVHWDGCFTRGNHYSSSVKDNADWMQILYTLTGQRAHLRPYWNKNPNSVTNYQIDLTDRDYSLTANAKKTRIPYSGKVYCVSVPSGFIVIRRGGNVCITGNCPRKDNDPIGIRSFIIAPKGNVLISLDFSQIELRVGAFYCRDKTMLETYRGGGEQRDAAPNIRVDDIHALTTSVIFKIPYEEAADKNAPHYKERRTIAKNCNFGVFFGLFAKGLQRNLKFKAHLEKTMPECEEIIQNLKDGYPRLVQWQEEKKRQAKATRYAETILGRRRYLPGITSPDWGKRSFAERCALNTPIQGTAADILKLALGRIIAGIPDRTWLKPLLQIHDELVFELPEDKTDEAVCFIKQCMEASIPGFDVPIIAEGSVGVNFGDMKELN